MSPGKKPNLSPASTAGLDSIILSIFLSNNIVNATATAKKVFPVPAGPVDIIISAVNGNAVPGGSVTTVEDPRDSDFLFAKYDGTSMASPQVCGALACLLEQEPRLSQSDCVAYLEQHCKSDQLTDSGGSTSDTTSLQGSSNRYLFILNKDLKLVF